MTDTDYMHWFERMDPPYASFSQADLGPAFADELDTVSRMWFACGYRPGVGAYLNFFLMRDFIDTHDAAVPGRFASFRTMAQSFYRTDLFIREVTDSGAKPTGGISSPKVRQLLRGMMARHARVAIPDWMMTCFGFSLVENVEKQVSGFTDRERQLHLDYMARTFRIMGIPFSADRALMERFTRAVEAAHAGPSADLERHARNILVLGEMVGVSSRLPEIGRMLPAATREAFERIYPRVRPGLVRRSIARAFGRLVMKRAIGAPRKAVPVSGDDSRAQDAVP